jgi:succinate dehydrogenase / fumarate reductase flavoprotein subunit
LQQFSTLKGKNLLIISIEIGHIMWDYVGMSRNEAGLKKAIEMMRNLKKSSGAMCAFRAK